MAAKRPNFADPQIMAAAIRYVVDKGIQPSFADLATIPKFRGPHPFWYDNEDHLSLAVDLACAALTCASRNMILPRDNYHRYAALRSSSAWEKCRGTK